MSEEIAAPEGVEHTSNEGGNSGWTPPASQDELNRIIADRVARERSKYTDYGDLKAKAAKFDEADQASKTETQREREAREAAEVRASKAEAALLRRVIAGNHGISDPDDIELFLTGADEETLTKQAKRLAARSEDSTKPRPPKPDPNQGRKGTAQSTTADSFAAFFSSQL